MLRIWTTLALTLLLTTSAWAQYGHKYGAYVDPSAFGQQTQATIDDNGIVTLRRTDVFRVYKEICQPETRTRIVKVDGVERTEQYTVEVPTVYSKKVSNNFQSRVSIDKIEAFDMAGKPIVADRLKQALQEETTVLLANRKVASYYLSVYKPETLLLVIEPQNLYQAVPDAPPPVPADAPAPAPAPAPVATPVPAAPPTPLPGMAPRVSVAKSANDTLVLRTFLKDIATQTAYREVRQESVTKKVPFSIETISISNVETKYPRTAVRVYRADGKPVTAEEIAKLLSSERGVLLSTDGENIDPTYLKIVQPQALIIVVPIPEPPVPRPGTPSA